MHGPLWGSPFPSKKPSSVFRSVAGIRAQTGRPPFGFLRTGVQALSYAEYSFNLTFIFSKNIYLDSHGDEFVGHGVQHRACSGTGWCQWSDVPLVAFAGDSRGAAASPPE